MTLQFLGYALPGAVVFLFGVGWSWGLAARPARPYATKQTGCCRALRLDKHPVQGVLKILVALVGIVGSLFAAYPDGSFQYVGDVQFATMYLFFALSGLLDVLACYCPHAVSRSHARLGLSLAFLAEAFLFHHVEGLPADPAGRQAFQLLVGVMAACGLATALAGVLPVMDAVRCVAAVVHGTWFYHCGVLLYWPRLAGDVHHGVHGVGLHARAGAPASPASPATLWVTLVFSWHCAAALSLLVVFLVTRRSLCPRDRRSRPFGVGHGHASLGLGPPVPVHSPSLSPSHGLPGLPLPRGPAIPLVSPHHSCVLCDAATTSSYHRSSSLA